MSRFAALLAGVLLFASLPAQAYIEDYLPASLQGKVKPIEQKQIMKEIKNDSDTTVGAYRIVNKEDGLSIHGNTKDGSPWTVRTDYVGLGGSAWTADFDANGQQDLLILGATGGCGIAPPTRVLTILFDGQGKPHPYETVGYEYDESRGAIDWVRVPNVDGGVLIQQDLTWVTGVTRDRSYWRFHLYQAKDAKIARLDGNVAGCQFPTFVWYTRNANHKLSSMCPMLERTTRSQQNDAWKELAVENK